MLTPDLTTVQFETATGQIEEIACDSIEEAKEAVEHLVDELFWADQEDADGIDKLGRPCFRLLAWASEEDAKDDGGSRAFGKLTWVAL